MDRKVLSERIQGLSEVFASDNAMHQDLKAMSYVLSQMSDERYASLISPEFTADKEAAGSGTLIPEAYPSTIMDDRRQRQEGYKGLSNKPGKLVPVELLGEMMEVMTEKGLPEHVKRDIIQALKEKGQKAQVAPGAVPAPAKQPITPGLLMASDESSSEGIYWTKEASNKVQEYLLKDVVGMDKSVCCDTGRKLDKEQMPDATKTQTKPATLKEEQTPKLSESLDSGIVEKAKAAKPVNKQAGSKKGPGIPDGTGPGKDSPECPMNKDKKLEKDSSEDSATCKAEQNAIKKIEEGLADFKKVEKKEKAEGEEGAHEKGEEKGVKDIEKGVDKIKGLEKKEKEDDKEATAIESEGIELTSSEMDVTLSSEDATELEKLFY